MARVLLLGLPVTARALQLLASPSAGRASLLPCGSGDPTQWGDGAAGWGARQCLSRVSPSPTGTDMAVFCLLCGKRFQTQSALQQHMEVHAGVRSYICSECNRTFPSHTALKRHLRSHTGTAAPPWGLGAAGTGPFPVCEKETGKKGGLYSKCGGDRSVLDLKNKTEKKKKLCVIS